MLSESANVPLQLLSDCVNILRALLNREYDVDTNRDYIRWLVTYMFTLFAELATAASTERL